MRSCRRLSKAIPKRRFREVMRSQITRQRDGCGVQGIPLKCYFLEGKRYQKGTFDYSKQIDIIDIGETRKLQGRNTSGIEISLLFFTHNCDRRVRPNIMALRNSLPFLSGQTEGQVVNTSYCKQPVGFLEILLLETALLHVLANLDSI